MTNQPVYVEWVDSLGSGNWIMLKEAVERAQKDSMLCSTIGWLIADTDEYILITHSLRVDEELGDDVMGTLQIPRVAIKKLQSIVWVKS